MRCKEAKGECSPASHAKRQRVAGGKQEKGGAQSFSQLTEGRRRNLTLLARSTQRGQIMTSEANKENWS